MHHSDARSEDQLDSSCSSNVNSSALCNSSALAISCAGKCFICMKISLSSHMKCHSYKPSVDHLKIKYRRI